MTKRLYLLVLSLLMGALTGCETLNYQERAVLREHNISPVLYQRMKYGEALNLEDIIELSRRGVPDRFIIAYLDSTNVVYRLTRENISHLRKANVSRAVIDYLNATPAIFGGGYRRWLPAYYPYEPYYPYAPYYGGYYGPSVGIGVGYGGYYGGHYGGRYPYRHW